MLAMLRNCSLLGNPWSQYYLLMADGHYVPSKSGQLNKAIIDEMYRHPDIKTFRMDDADMKAKEVCAWCGTLGNGRLFCSKCGPICWGGVIENSYVRCHCGQHGKITTVQYEHVGVVPRGRLD
jgi:hypothetical protein